MKTEMRAKVVNELKRAYVHFGEYDEELMNERAEEEVEALSCRIIGTAPETIGLDGDTLQGYVINVAVSAYRPETIENVIRNGKAHTKETVVEANLVVTKTDMVYVLSTYDVYKSEGWVYGDEFEFENETCKRVSLEDIDVSLFN